MSNMAATHRIDKASAERRAREMVSKLAENSRRRRADSDFPAENVPVVPAWRQRGRGAFSTPPPARSSKSAAPWPSRSSPVTSKYDTRSFSDENMEEATPLAAC